MKGEKMCPVCTRMFIPNYPRQKFCCRECCSRHITRIKEKFGSLYKFKKWLDSGLIDWKDYNEFKI